MWVRVIRVPAIPGGVSVFFDDQPEGIVIWLQEDEFSESTAAAFQAGLSLLSLHWTRIEGVEMRGHLRAV